ncbi:MAG: DUF4743 domain-containing protein [Rhodovibrionaceae bacterium]
MSLLHHLRETQGGPPKSRLPWRVAGRRMGWIEPALARRLAAFPKVFAVTPQAVELVSRLASPADRTAAVAEAAEKLVQTGGLPPLRGEGYPVLRAWGEAPLLEMDRALAPCFGFRDFGVHVNGLRWIGGELHLWTARRAADKATMPGKLDQMVGGGQPAGLSLTQNLIKECAEEAGLPENLARLAKPVGTVSFLGVWSGCNLDGLHDGAIFCFDLEMPEELEPHNTDGEVESFALLPADEVLRLLRESEEFVYDVALVNLDCLIRHGVLTPDNEADYQELVSGLRIAEAP